MALALASREPEVAPMVGGLPALLDMLTYRRPAGSDTERAFINKFIRPLGPHVDDYGNLWLQIGDNPNILWSAHTDTVHHRPGRQRIEVNADFVTLAHDQRKGRGKSNCLGADNAGGVWLLLEMYRAEVPGVYVFHREEETGGGGSMFVANHEPHKLEGIEFAIAFDRKGYGDIITHQGGRTASDAFARSLASILGMGYRPDDTGVFTDTANYVDIIPECSNVSIGYFGGHGPLESLDLNFIQKLRDILVAADFSTLVSARKPGVREFDPADKPWWHDDDLQTSWLRRGQPYGGGWADDDDKAYDFGDLLAFVRTHPETVADFLDTNGFTARDLRRWML